jgi:hypothetical protein
LYMLAFSEITVKTEIEEVLRPDVEVRVDISVVWTERNSGHVRGGLVLRNPVLHYHVHTLRLQHTERNTELLLCFRGEYCDTNADAVTGCPSRNLPRYFSFPPDRGHVPKQAVIQAVLSAYRGLFCCTIGIVG